MEMVSRLIIFFFNISNELLVLKSKLLAFLVMWEMTKIRKLWPQFQLVNLCMLTYNFHVFINRIFWRRFS